MHCGVTVQGRLQGREFLHGCVEGTCAQSKTGSSDLHDHLMRAAAQSDHRLYWGESLATYDSNFDAVSISGSKYPGSHAGIQEKYKVQSLLRLLQHQVLRQVHIHQVLAECGELFVRERQ